jgi:hypothetical protein
MNFICVLYGLFYRLLKTWTGNYKWQKTPDLIIRGSETREKIINTLEYRNNPKVTE